MQAVILAAGKGKRLQPLTLKRSKAMQPILGIPILGRVIENLHAHGVSEFIVVINPNEVQVQKYFQEEFPLPVDFQFAYQDQPLGTGDALRKAAPLIRKNFILSACDNLIPDEEMGKLLDHWRRSLPPNGLLTLLEVPEEQIPKGGIVELDGTSVEKIIEKPTLERAPSNIASLPLYIFQPQLLRHLDKLKPSIRGEYELQEAIQRLIDNDRRVEGFFVSQRLTLTRSSDLLKINRYYLNREKPVMKIVRTDSIGENTRFIPPVYIESGVSIGSNCTIGPEVYIEKGCHIGDYVTIQKSITLQGAILANGETVSDSVLSP